MPTHASPLVDRFEASFGSEHLCRHARQRRQVPQFDNRLVRMYFYNKWLDDNFPSVLWKSSACPDLRPGPTSH